MLSHKQNKLRIQEESCTDKKQRKKVREQRKEIKKEIKTRVGQLDEKKINEKIQLLDRYKDDSNKYYQV